MRSARQTIPDHARPGRAPRVPAINRTLVWFHDEAAQRRRSMAAAQEELRQRTATELAWVGPDDPSYADIRRHAQARRATYLRELCRHAAAALKALPTRMPEPSPRTGAGGGTARGATVWQRPELFGCVALAAVALAMVGGPSFNAAWTGPCRTEPATLATGAVVDATMTVSNNAACAIWTKGVNTSVNDVKIAVPPQHGTLALRGRTGVTYRPAREFTGDDFFSFALRGRSAARDGESLVRVRVSVRP